MLKQNILPKYMFSLNHNFILGWVGVLFIFGCGIICGYSGMLLGKCWTILLEKYPDKYTQTYERRPYPTIAQEAYGTWLR